jgi:hypothetical protein
LAEVSAVVDDRRRLAYAEAKPAGFLSLTFQIPILPSPQSGEMFIDTLLKKDSLPPEEQNVLFGYQCLTPKEL